MGALDGRRETTGAVNHVATDRHAFYPRAPARIVPLIPSAFAISMEKLQAKLQVASTEYQKLQNDLSVAVDSRQRLDAQLQENEMVKKVRWNLASSELVRVYVAQGFPSGICSIDFGKRSLQTYRSGSGETGPAGSKGERGSTVGIDPGRYVSRHFSIGFRQVSIRIVQKANGNAD